MAVCNHQWPATFGANTRCAADSDMFDTISSANTIALCTTPAGRAPACSTAATNRAAVSGWAMSPVMTCTRIPAAFIAAIAAPTSALGTERPLSTTRPAPCATSQRATTSPNPPMPPTTM
ncbi:hypothetical protein NIIDMKKI_12240 [Mycobacterium kansasii]|uniref:Uncharacterized protein n=1 Tax=Mycobacterium kansasii TaxID=1768 RepID=A0A7G1IC35_MYCKA|nr:hypothetical protein NIIDMKKI_12240 [Mycobacterium kansasii]